MSKVLMKLGCGCFALMSLVACQTNSVSGEFSLDSQKRSLHRSTASATVILDPIKVQNEATLTIKSQSESDCLEPLVQKLLSSSRLSDWKVVNNGKTTMNLMTGGYSFNLVSPDGKTNLNGKIRIGSARIKDSLGNSTDQLMCKTSYEMTCENFSSFYVETTSKERIIEVKGMYSCNPMG